MKIAHYLSIIVAAAIVSGCGTIINGGGLDHHRAGTFLDGSDLTPIPRTDVEIELNVARLVVLGLDPDSSIQPGLSAEIADIASRYASLSSLTFGMLAKKEQARLHQALRTRTIDGAIRPDAMAWADKSWPEHDLFMPLIDAAQRKDSLIAAGGLDPSLEDAVRRQGLTALPSGILKRLKVPTLPPSPPDMIDFLFDQNCRLASPAIMERADLWRARIAVMADRVITVTGKGRGILVSDVDLLDRRWGLPFLLNGRRQGPLGGTRQSLTVALVEEGDRAKLSYLQGQVDLIWITPFEGRARPDPCAPSLQAGLRGRKIG